jgi:hypothetical protein
MSAARHLPVPPDLKQLQRQAKEFLRAIRRGDTAAIAELHERHPETIGRSPTDVKLADAQLALARSYHASSWTRLVHAVRLANAIWRDDITAVRGLVDRNPQLLHEHVLIRGDDERGLPMTFAAGLGRDRIVRLLHEAGARDLATAAGHAALRDKTDTVRMIWELTGRPSPEAAGWGLASSAYTLSVEETAVQFALGVRVDGPHGIDTNAIEHLLGTDSRNPPAKHRILALWIEHGFEPPDTPVMALHRGRIDLLEAHLARDPTLLTRTFEIAEVFPNAPACARDPYMAQGTPVHGTTLLHIAAYFDELEIATWLLDRGMDPNARAAIDANGFGGYTALFSSVVSQQNFWVNYRAGRPDEARFTRLLLDRGADPNVRASLRARLEPGHGGGLPRDYRDVTALMWGEQYHASIFVSHESLRLIEARGGSG